jgi:hypothetical protein
MKQLTLIAFLTLSSIAALAQSIDKTLDEEAFKNSRAPFQGIWYGVVYSDSALKTIFIFIDDIFIMNYICDFPNEDFYGTNESYYSRFSVKDKNLIMMTNKHYLNEDRWEYASAEPEVQEIQYVFSGKRLILIFDGYPITLSRDYLDFDEWR